MSTTTHTRLKQWLIFVLAAVLLFSSIFIVSSSRTAEAESVASLSDRAAELQRQINEANKVAEGLAAQAGTLEAKLRELDNQISLIVKEIELTDVRLQELNEKLIAATKELERQKELLRVSMNELYMNSGASTIEMIANSDNFSEFVNEQKYLEQLKSGIQDSTQRVIDLKAEIEAQKTEQERLKAQQEAQKTQLSAVKTEQSDLLAYTKGEEEKYRAHVADLRSQQAAINAELASRLRARGITRGGTGGYPYNDVGYPCWSGAECADPWGMFKRECVSYAAWKVWSTGRDMPFWGGRGNANRWPDNARAAGIPVDNNPRAGDVAISLSGPYGHAMYVEHVNSDGSIFVSQYNFSITGEYSTMTINAGNLQFIHF